MDAREVISHKLPRMKSQLELPSPFHEENMKLRWRPQKKDDEVVKHAYCIPLLGTVFHRYPDTAVNLDLKDNDPLLAEKVHHMVKKYNREHLVAWGSSLDVNCKRCYELNPNIPLVRIHLHTS